jgi:hypothetical protein
VALASACLAACAAPLPPPVDPSEVEIEPPTSAFVVYTADATLVVPVLPEEAGAPAALASSGLWLLDAEGRVVRVGEPAAAAGEADPAEGEAEPAEGETDPAEGEAGPPACSPEVTAYGPVSLVGGALQSLERIDAGTCEDLPAVAFRVETTAIVDAAGEPPELGDAVCLPGVPFDDWSLLERPCPRRSRRPECEGCAAPVVEAAVLAAWSGRLVELGLAPGDAGRTVTLVRSAALSPEACPSEADPCGDVEGFVGLDRWDAFWISSEGEAALALREGELAVLLPGLEEPLWGGLEVGGEVLGVRYHEDATALRRAMEAVSPEGP